MRSKGSDVAVSGEAKMRAAGTAVEFEAEGDRSPLDRDGHLPSGNAS